VTNFGRAAIPFGGGYATVNWLGILSIAVVVIALVSFVGARPKGGRPVEGTQLMTVARVVALVTGLAIAWVAFGR